jgi:hypothetical protein
MDSRKHILTLLTLVVAVSPFPAGGLASVRRAIAKEPAYQSKRPKFCLLVFGRDAQSRIWLVIDGERLYADRNSNGDLTDQGEMKRAITWGDKGGTYFEFGALTIMDGKKMHLAVTHHPKGDQSDRMTISVAGRDVQYAGTDWQGPLKFADRPQDAPIVHFSGPLSMRPFAQQALVRGGGMQDLSTMIGTQGLGAGTFAPLSCDQAPKTVHPVAEIEFPPRLNGGESLRIRVPLDQRC